MASGIPTQIGGLTNLTDLRLNNNQLTGSIPSTIGNLTGLTILDLGSNHLTGTVPSTIGNLTALTILGLSGNELSGALPSAIANLTHVGQIQLQGNKIASLPPSIGTMSTLQALWAYSNNLTFSSILPIKATFHGQTFAYSGQGPVDQEKTFTAYIGYPHTLTTNIDRNTNPVSIYQWFKRVNGVSTPLNTASASSHTVVIANVAAEDEGAQYHYTITNPAVSDLNLSSKMQTMHAMVCPQPTVDFQFEEINAVHNFTPYITGLDSCTVTYAWDFGDGNVSALKSATHEFGVGGTYNVKLTISYDCGACPAASLSKEYAVNISNNGLCDAIYCDGEGGVGIGTRKTQGFSLSVNGKIRAGDIIKVYPRNQWSDFVFEKNYVLKPLSEVEKYIKNNGHLPDVPSASEVEKQGIDLGAMDAKLLQKIEELTLYMIELKKENETLKKEVNALKAKVN